MWTIHERLRFHVLSVMAMVAVPLYATGSMRMRWGDLVVPLASAAIVLAGAAYFRRQERREGLSATLVAVAQITLFAALAAVLNYLLLSDRPLIDALLLRLDAAIGVHWQSLFALLKGGAFGSVLTVAYESNGIMIAGVVVLLGLTGRAAELDRFLLAFFVATLSALAFWAVFPSFGAATYLVSTGATTDLAGATVGRAFAQVLLGLKSGVVTEMFLADLKGLVAFPSVHTVMALLCVYAVRDIKIVFWPGLVWAALMLLSIPVDGGHHVVDVVAGVGLTVASVAAARHVCARIEWRASRQFALPALMGTGLH